MTRINMHKPRLEVEVLSGGYVIITINHNDRLILLHGIYPAVETVIDEEIEKLIDRMKLKNIRIPWFFALRLKRQIRRMINDANS